MAHESLFITIPDSFEEASRTNTSFGLRSLEYAHDEEVVPKIGSLEFVRQASWAVAAIKLFSENEEIRERAKTPTILANAIEALGCKLEYTYDSKTSRQKHIRGSLAFKRSASKALWRFSDLKKSSNYVQNTFRQNVVSALQSLGLCNDNSTRFNQMQLSDIGIALADSFLSKQERDVKKFLTRWVCANSVKIDTAYMEVLSPDFPCDGEKEIIGNCLNSFVTGGKPCDREKRIRLIKLMRKIPARGSSPWIKLKNMLQSGDSQDKEHCKQIENAIRFESVKKGIRNLYNECANYMYDNHCHSCKFSTLSRVDAIAVSYTKVLRAIKSYRNAKNLPNISLNNPLLSSAYKDIKKALCYLVKHEGRALIYNGDSVIAGPLLKRDGFATNDEYTGNWEHPKLRQLYNLWRECYGK